MEIPAYQIHKVMKVYTKQLSRSKILEEQKALGKKSSTDKINISQSGKRQAIIDKVANDIIERITKFGPKEDVDHEIVNKLEKELGENVNLDDTEKSQFVFNVINEKNVKTTTSLPVEDSSFLLKRLEQLTKEIVDKNMEL